MSHERTGHKNIYRRGDTFYFRFKCESGRWIERRYGTDLQGAVLAQTRAQQEADAIRGGLTTRAKLDSQRNQYRQIGPAIDEYLASLEAGRNTPGHVNQCRSRCNAVANALGWKTLDDMHPGQLEAFLDVLTTTGRGARSRNDYLVKIQAFANWCVRRRYIPVSPLGSIPTANTKSDPKRPYRALTPTEFQALLAAAERERPLAYWLAGGLGLRWTEIRQLDWTHVDIGRGWICLPASIAKNRKEAWVPMPPPVVKALKAIQTREGSVCPHPPILRTFKDDVKRAKIGKAAGGSVHRRSLRKTFITHLAIAGIDLRTAQRLARHSRPELTANVYTDPHLLDMNDAMKRIGTLQSGTNMANRNHKKRKSV